MNNGEMTRGQETKERIYSYVVDYIKAHGYPPTVREIGNGVHMTSTSSVHSHLLQMVEGGMLETDARNGSPRAIRVPGYRFVRDGGSANGETTENINGNCCKCGEEISCTWAYCPNCGRMIVAKEQPVVGIPDAGNLMKLHEFMRTYSGNAGISIGNYCESETYDYYLMPLNEWGEPDEEIFSGNNPNHYIPSCLEKEPWWKDIADKAVVQWCIIGGGTYSVELCIELGLEDSAG